MVMYGSDCVMICTTEIPSITYTLNNLLIPSYLYSSYTQTIYNDKQEIMNYICITYVKTLVYHINHPALVKEWKLNLDVAAYEIELYAKSNEPSD